MNYKIIGFTGTKNGMTNEQESQVILIIAEMRSLEMARHGDCMGADYTFNIICDRIYHIKNIIVHPPNNPKYRVFTNNNYINKTVTRIMEEKPYLERNHDIVDCSDLMIATPKENEEQLRSGTWATIRYARKQKRPLIIVYPDGRVEKENGVN